MKYTNIADALEAVADYVDTIEHSKLAAEKQARDARLNTLSERYHASTGNTVPDSIKEKLASLDAETLDELLKVAHNNNESPASLGGPADLEDGNTAPRSTKEAAVQAEDRFTAWLTSE